MICITYQCIDHILFKSICKHISLYCPGTSEHNGSFKYTYLLMHHSNVHHVRSRIEQWFDKSVIGAGSTVQLSCSSTVSGKYCMRTTWNFCLLARSQDLHALEKSFTFDCCLFAYCHNRGKSLPECNSCSRSACATDHSTMQYVALLR